MDDIPEVLELPLKLKSNTVKGYKGGGVMLPNFKAAILKACNDGDQVLVDRLVWDAMKDVSIRDEMLRLLRNWGNVHCLQVSVFTSPVFDEGCIDAVLENSRSVWRSCIAVDVVVLANRVDFSGKVLFKLLDTFATQALAGEGIRLVLLLESKFDVIPLEWLVYVYSVEWPRIFYEKKTLALADGSVEVVSVSDMLFTQVCKHYPDLPVSWVEHMFKVS